MRNKKLIIIPISIILVVALFYFLRTNTSQAEHLKGLVQEGDFFINVYTSGELEAKNSENILGPSGLRMVGLWNVQISELIPEGSIVQEGDWVATLDRTEISNRLKDLETELEKQQTLHTQTRLDTTMTMRNARDELINLQFSLEEARIGLEQSMFEPPASIRQQEIHLEKAERGYNQAVQNYQLRLEQASAKMQEVTASLNQVKRRHENSLAVLDEFVIHAPKAGMVIYKRGWDGTKVTVGSQISTWDLTVATLPDFSTMLSKTFVNEVDISKVQANQKAEIIVDAFPDKVFTGFVTEVANIGEQRPNQDSRVFEVKIQINEFDSILRPAMTTKNTIMTHKEPDVLYIPIEAIHRDGDITFVYTQQQGRIVRKQIETGLRNENHIIVKAGLEKGEEVLLSIPGMAEDFRLIAINES